MKIKILVLCLFLAVSSAFAQKQKFEIKGTVDSKLQGKKLYFTRIKMYGATKPQATLIAVNNGKFLLKGELEEPEQGMISFTDSAKPDSSSLTFLIDKGEMELKLAEKLKASEISGSKANSDFKSYLSATRTETEEFNQFYQSLTQEAIKGASRDSLQLVFKNAYSLYLGEMNSIRLKFIKENPKAFMSLILLPEVAQHTHDYKLVDSLYNSLDKDIKNSPSAKIINEKFERERQLAIGAVAPVFSQPDVNGKLVKLSDFKGKYVLLDFWASWCGPCRQENPNVVKAYNQFKDKNFTVLGVSLDRPGAKSAWLKAIADDNLTWTQVSDLNFWKNEAAVMYNVTSIPQNYLLDPEGKIIAKNLRGEDLEAMLANLLK